MMPSRFVVMSLALVFATPAEARFLQADPLGVEAGPNLYAYAANDPLNATDPSGLDTYYAGFGGAIVSVLGGVFGVGGFTTDTNKYGLPDIGFYRSIGPAVGANVSVGVTGGVQYGNLSQFQGRSINVEGGAFLITGGASFVPSGATTFNRAAGYYGGVSLGSPVSANIASVTTTTFGVVEDVFVPLLQSLGINPFRSQEASTQLPAQMAPASFDATGQIGIPTAAGFGVPSFPTGGK